LCDFVNIYELKIKIQKGAIMILLFLLSFSILPIIVGFLEIFLVEKIFNINMKYIKLLKIFELITPFIALINQQGTGKIAERVLPIFFLLSLTYFIVLVYDFFKGKIDGNEFIINFIFYFLDVIFTFLSILLAVSVIF